MSKDVILSRCNDIYKEIEEFEPYELTNCIAYEMAIRNEHILDLLSKNKYFDEKLIDFGFSISDFYYYKKSNDYKRKEIRVVIHNDVYLHNDDEDDYSLDVIDGHWYKSDLININTVDKSYIPDLMFRCSRPELKFDMISEYKIKINLALPLEELKAQIEDIKKEYDKDNSIIKSPLELLGEVLSIETIDYKKMTSKEWADCFFIYDYFKDSKDYQKSTKLQKLQELLTEYNGMKVEKTKPEIRRSKNKNDNSKYKIVSFEAYLKLKKDGVYVNKNVKSFYSIKTIEDRLKLMTILIDDLKYKFLIS